MSYSGRVEMAETRNFANRCGTARACKLYQSSPCPEPPHRHERTLTSLFLLHLSSNQHSPKSLTMSNLSDIRLLQASTDPEDISEFRIQVDGQYVKYVTIAPGIYDEMDLLFEPTLTEILRAVLPTPTRDWTHAHISQGSVQVETGNENIPARVEVSKQTLPGVNRTWHPIMIDYLDLEIGARLRSNVYEASHPRFPRPVIVKFARFGWEIPWLEAETTAYEWIEGHSIGPDFLGHLTEHGRVIGFIMSRVEDARHAMPHDLNLCRRALETLHDLKIKHGDTNKHNFLIHANTVTLIDFDVAVKNAGTEELRDELQDLERQLSDTSGRGGRISHDS